MYLQAASLEEPGQMVVETRLQEGESGFRHYSYTTADTRRSFSGFGLLGKQELPKLEDWQDISHEMS